MIALYCLDVVAKRHGLKPSDIGVCRSQGDDNLNIIVAEFADEFAAVLASTWLALGLELDGLPVPKHPEEAKWLSSKFYNRGDGSWGMTPDLDKRLLLMPYSSNVTEQTWGKMLYLK